MVSGCSPEGIGDLLGSLNPSTFPAGSTLLLLEDLGMIDVALRRDRASRAVTLPAFGIRQITRVRRQSVRSPCSLLVLPALGVIQRYRCSAPKILGLRIGTLWDTWNCIQLHKTSPRADALKSLLYTDYMDFVSGFTQFHEVQEMPKRGFDSLYPIQITSRFGFFERFFQ
jgi:hypothetical protein